MAYQYQKVAHYPQGFPNSVYTSAGGTFNRLVNPPWIPQADINAFNNAQEQIQKAEQEIKARQRIWL